MAAFAQFRCRVGSRVDSTLQLFESDKTEQLKQWRDDLSELVRKSFVDVVKQQGLDESGNEIAGRRYRLHPLMRQYASLKADNAAMSIHRNRASHLFLAYAEEQGTMMP